MKYLITVLLTTSLYLSSGLISVFANDFILNVAKANAPYVTVSDAIAAIPAGTTDKYVIQVAPGTYNECNLLLPSNVSLKGSGLSSSFLYCSWINVGIKLLNVSNVDISGFTLKGERGTSLLVDNSSNVTISNNAFIGTSSYQRGVKFFKSPVHNILENNQFLGLHLAIEVIASKPWIRDNGVYAANGNGRYGINTYGGASPIIEDNIIDGLSSDAIFLSAYADNGTGTEPSNPTVKNNIIKNNGGHGIGLKYLSHATVKGNIIKNNNIGIHSYNATYTAENNTVVDNTAFDISINGFGSSLFSFNRFDTYFRYQDQHSISSIYNINSAGQANEILNY